MPNQLRLRGVGIASVSSRRCCVAASADLPIRLSGDSRRQNKGGQGIVYFCRALVRAHARNVGAPTTSGIRQPKSEGAVGSFLRPRLLRSPGRELFTRASGQP